MIANKDAGVSARGIGRLARRLAAPPGLQPEPVPHDRLIEAIDTTSHWLLDQQHDAGYWVGELEGDTILESEYVLLLAYLGRLDDPVCVKACRYIRSQQVADGGWAIYPGGPSEVSASVKAYFALKLLGIAPDDPAMARARAAILAAGGAQASNSFTRFYMALLGQIDYDDCPSVPPELVLLPSWLNFSLAAMSAWTRTIVVPLSIISAFKPVRKLAPEQGIAELFRTDLPRRMSRRTRAVLSWANLFLAIDRMLKWADRGLPRSWRRPGVQAAHRWILEHCENSDGLGAIFPPMISTVIALECLGYPRDSALVQWALRQLDGLIIEERGTVRLQPCLSPIWDTAITTIALADAGLPGYHPALLGAVRWLLEKEVRKAGDWQVRRRGIEPTGWHFQFHNERYPDLDDTAMVLLALQRTALAAAPEVREATQRGVNWLLGMQNRDGGWAAYDVDIDNEVLTKVPFADHNAMLDPSCADITARVLELLGVLGYRAGHPSVARALEYLWRTQEPQGCWYGRWGVNYIYGTWQVLQGLKALDFPMSHPALIKAADWLESVQQAEGGWGESCASYEDPALMGQGEPTASQTAWAVLALIAAGRARSDAVLRGIEFLLASRRDEGTWDEECFTGTGFPRVFYLKYHLYRINFPLMAIARYQAAVGQLPEETTTTSASSTSAALACRIPALPRPFDI
jgi:squalene-hopene/tetraprenyl-beta-curcumene cyclase